MKRHVPFLLFMFILSVSGCSSRPAAPKDILARINSYEITKEEFEEEFKNSVLGRLDTDQTREEFLNNLINRKLILQDAQTKGLDKEKAFLKMIERFLEQSLVKIALDKKASEIIHSCAVSDKEAEEEYARRVKDGRASKPYVQAHSELRWEILRSKESAAMSNWMSELNRKADIKINYDLLKEKR